MTAPVTPVPTAAPTAIAPTATAPTTTAPTATPIRHARAVAAAALVPGRTDRSAKSIAARSAAGSPADVAVGVLLALLAAANLVQGLWVESAPLLDLTVGSFLLLVPATALALARADARRPDAHLLGLLVVAVALGFHAAGMNAGAADKRLQVVPGVLVTFLAGYALLSNGTRVRAFAWTLLAQSLVVLAALVVVPDVAALALTGRRSPTGLNPIASGRILAAGALVLVCLGLQHLHRTRGRLALLLALPLFIGAGTTGSRGPLAAVLAAVVVVVVRQEQVSRTAKAGALTGTLLLVGLLRFVQQDSRLADLTDTSRIQLLTESLKVALAHPWGVGWGNLYDYLPAWANSPTQGYKQYPHNVLVEFLVETGWLGGLLFAVFLVKVAQRSWALAGRPDLRLVGALGIFCLVNALLSSDIVGNRILWVVAGAVLAGARPSHDSPGGAGCRSQGPARPMRGYAGSARP